MKKYIISIDLGSTLIKYAIYDAEFNKIANSSLKYDLIKKDSIVEFDAEDYWNCLKSNLRKLIKDSGLNPLDIASIGLSGQAETVILFDSRNNILRNAISWMDQRSETEVEELRNFFNEEKSYKVTGQPKIITTWTATKLAWLKKNEPHIYKKINKILLLKDFIAFKFSGLFVGEYSTYNYSYYFDVYNKYYWKEMLNYLELKTDNFPDLIEPGTNAGYLLEDIRSFFGFNENIILNIGANDQFAGMVGVGNIDKGIISEATGTVLSIATTLDKNSLDNINLPVHCGALQNSYVCLMTSDSGGICLEWFKNNFLKDKNFKEIDGLTDKIQKGSNGLVFLPYLIGANAPEYDLDVSGSFFNIGLNHTEFHFARSVMEGIGFLIRKNIEFIEKAGIKISNIIVLGGGSKSNLWNQIKADITGKKVVVTGEEDSVCLGIAVLSSLGLRYYEDIYSAVKKAVKLKSEFHPKFDERYENNYRLFNLCYSYNKAILNQILN